MTRIEQNFLLPLANRIVRWYRKASMEKLKSSLLACGDRVYISDACLIWGIAGVSLGNDVALHSFTHIFGSGGVTIGDRTMVSASCSIASVSHPEAVGKRLAVTHAPVTIGADCWLGTGAIILPGVTIGNGSIIAAGAVVTRDIPPGVVAAGVPARPLRAVQA